MENKRGSRFKRSGSTNNQEGGSTRTEKKLESFNEIDDQRASA